MYMTRETIIELYQKAVEEGKGPQQIKALAKANHVQPGEIRKILTDAGEYVPRQKPGPKVKCAGNMSEAAGNEEATEEPQEAAGDKSVKINPVLKEVMLRGIKDLEKELSDQRGLVEDKQTELRHLKERVDDEVATLAKLEELYLAAKTEYIGILFEEGVTIENLKAAVKEGIDIEN